MASFRYISLRVKITGAFILIVIVGTSVGTYLGSRIVTSAMMDQALKRVEHGLQTARMIYTLRLERVQRSVHRAAMGLEGQGERGEPDGMTATLARLASENLLDFLGVVYADGRINTSERPLGLPTDTASDLRHLLSDVAIPLREPTAGTLVLPEGFLQTWHPSLAAKARIWSGASAAEGVQIADGLVLFSTEPVRGADAFLYGGVLLNLCHPIVEEIEEAVFGGETFEGRRVGRATIFLGDVRIATTVTLRSGERAEGTRVSPAVAQTVLARGERWRDRAHVVSDWYVTAYEPLRDISQRIVGMLSVGVLEAPFLAVRTRMMRSFLWLAGAGLIVVLGLTVWVTRRMTRPLMEMVAASKRVAAGDLTRPVEVASRDEIGHLAVSFNRMQTSLEQARAELQEWAHTLEDRVRQRTEQLVAVQARMMQAERLAALGRMAAGVAHEINNPLGGILTFAMLALEDCPPDNPLRKNLEVITSQTLRCRDIVKGLLEFSRQSEAAAVETDLSEVADRSLAVVEKQPAFQNIRVLRRFAAGLPRVLVDPGQWQQVVVNLIMNAADAIVGEGEIEVETSHDTVSEEVILRVRDTGRGIPEEVLPHIFEPFFTTKEVGKGTGLGLAIVHGIVTRAGGRIDVESSPAGTTFTIRLPVAGRPHGE